MLFIVSHDNDLGIMGITINRYKIQADSLNQLKKALNMIPYFSRRKYIIEEYNNLLICNSFTDVSSNFENIKDVHNEIKETTKQIKDCQEQLSKLHQHVHSLKFKLNEIMNLTGINTIY